MIRDLRTQQLEIGTYDIPITIEIATILWISLNFNGLQT